MTTSRGKSVEVMEAEDDLGLWFDWSDNQSGGFITLKEPYSDRELSVPVRKTTMLVFAHLLNEALREGGVTLRKAMEDNYSCERTARVNGVTVPRYSI